jgi:AbrB family looped-hinge helix DNA binding protein
MRYITTITSKGQMTVPKAVRARLHLSAPSRVVLDLDEATSRITLAPTEDIPDLAGALSPAQVVPATEIRERMEDGYGVRADR